MLTKGDLSAIGKIFDDRLDEKFDKRFDTRLEQTFDKKLKPIHDDIKIIKKDVKKLQKDVGGVINMADKGLLKVQGRVKKIEKHLGFPETDFA